MSDELLSTIATLKRQAGAHVQELKAQPQMDKLIKIHAAMNTLEGLCGIEPTPLSELFGLESSPLASQTRPLVAVGEFFGKQPLEAAKIYLRRKGSPASLGEIIDNLTLGSCDVKNKEALRVSLGRSTFEIARLNDDNFGLLDWYPEEKQKRSWSGKKRVSPEATTQPDDVPEHDGMNEPPGM